MRVSYNWLKDYVNCDLEPRTLAQRLTDRGVVVEGITCANPGVEGVLVGRVAEMERHPQADTLWVCQIDVGGGTRLQIVTGAQNVSQGDLVPVAVPGSKIPGRTLSVANLRGLESHGMLCSPDELGIDEGGDGILILPSDPALVPGMDAVAVLGLNDWIFELDLTTNYAAHCQSMTGVAQEVAAILGVGLRMPEIQIGDAADFGAHELVSVRIEAQDLCTRYVARVVRGVKIGPSPAWLQARLRAAGMRPINNIVDISNYVMLELGQPLHTFDYSKIRGREIIVRRARPGEPFTTLDGQERILDPDILVIAERSGPVAMAGVMGGLDSEVTAETVDILIESAHFDNINNRRTALNLNLTSEASRRFTKGVDPSGCLRAADRAAQLIAGLAGGMVVAGHVDVYPEPAVPPVILLRVPRVNDHLGLYLPGERMAEHLSSLGMAVLSPEEFARDLSDGRPSGRDTEGSLVWKAIHRVSPTPVDPLIHARWEERAWAVAERTASRLETIWLEETLVVVVPTRRIDIAEEIDLIEGVARSEGYDAIPAVLPMLATRRGGRSPLGEMVLRARRILAGAGLDEVMSHSLTHPGVDDRLRFPADSFYRQHIAVANPMYEDRSVLRTSLLPGLLDIVQHNANRQIRDLGLFEISQTYHPQAGTPLPDEPRMLGLALLGNQAMPGWNSPERPADFFVLKGLIEHLLDGLNVRDWSLERSHHPTLHPGRQARLIVGGEPGGYFGELHPDVQAVWDLPDRIYVAELAFEKLFAVALPEREYRQVARFPAITRDMALVVGQEVLAAQVLEAIRSAGAPILEEVALFDLYEGEHIKEGSRSLAYRLTYRSPERTLSDADVEPVHGRVRQAIQVLGAELRS